MLSFHGLLFELFWSVCDKLIDYARIDLDIIFILPLARNDRQYLFLSLCWIKTFQKQAISKMHKPKHFKYGILNQNWSNFRILIILIIWNLWVVWVCWFVHFWNSLKTSVLHSTEGFLNEREKHRKKQHSKLKVHFLRTQKKKEKKKLFLEPNLTGFKLNV